MRSCGMHYFPLTAPFILAFVFLVLIIITLVELHILKHVYQRIGIPSRYVLAVLIGSLLGSAINLPVAQLRPEPVVTDAIIDYFGVRYIVPAVEEWPRTIIAINIGGALVPTVVSIYLLVKNRLFLRGLLAVAIVSAIVHQFAQPVHGVGISIPIFVPPLVAAATAMLLAWRKAPPLAYIAGSLGTLIGADLLNLGNIQGLGAPIASIGGAGTFDGIFLTGILAVLLTPIADVNPTYGRAITTEENDNNVAIA
jgi:uncharacterized membrane protein